MKKIAMLISVTSMFLFVLLAFMPGRVNAEETASPYQKLSDYIMQNGKNIMIDAKERVCISEEADNEYTYYLTTDPNNKETIECLLLYTGDDEKFTDMKAQVDFHDQTATYQVDIPATSELNGSKTKSIIVVKGSVDAKNYKKDDIVEVESVENGEIIGGQVDYTTYPTVYVSVALTFFKKQLDTSGLGLTVADFGFESVDSPESNDKAETEVTEQVIDDALQGKWHISDGAGGDFTFSNGIVMIETNGTTMAGTYTIDVESSMFKIEIESSDGVVSRETPYEYKNGQLIFRNSAGVAFVKQ